MTAPRVSEIALLAFLALWSAVADAQPSPSGHRGPAKTYAPALWLAQEEPFYPMIPHPFAFDGIDNNGDSRVDLADPDEIRAFSRSELETSSGRDAHARALRRVFGRLLDIRSCVESPEHQLSGALTAARCAASHEPPSRIAAEAEAEGRVAARTDGGRMGEIPLLGFHTCGALWNRPGSANFRCGPDPVVMVGESRAGVSLQSRDVGATKLTAAPGDSGRGPISAIQYWMYYPWDAGHIDDGEHVSVFFQPSLATERNRDVKGVVGAGHEGHTSNNILIASKDETAGTLSPRSLPRHLPFLVELGKHASAPDFNCNGRFDVGVDANVAPRGAWGSRDTMVSIQTRSIAPFRDWMSVERDGSGFLIERSALKDEELKQQWEGACPEFTRGRDVMNSILGGRAVPSSAEGVAVASHTYRLVDAEVLRSLTKKIRAGDPAAIVAELMAQRHVLWGEDRAPSSIVLGPCEASAADAMCLSPESLEALGSWLAHPAKGHLRARRDVWDHGDFERFDQDFKRHLFKQFGFGISPRVDDGNFKLGIMARVAGLGPLMDSSVDVGVYFDDINDDVARRYGRKLGSVSDITLTYNAFRTSYYGVFGGVSLRPPYSEFELVKVHEGAGLSEKSVIVERRLDWNAAAFAGVAAALSRNRSRLTLRAGASAPLGRGTLPDGSAHRSRARVGLLLGVDFVVGFRNEKHPLER